jgi:hypothetical protein
MVGTVFTAFFGAGITNVSTQLANCIRMLAFQAHKLSCCPANGSTFHIQLYAFGHVIYVLFFQTS